MLCDTLKLRRLKCRKVAFDDGACAEIYMLWGDLKNADVMSADQLHKKVFLRTVKDDMWPDQPPVKGFHTDSDQSATALLRYVNVKRAECRLLHFCTFLHLFPPSFHLPQNVIHRSDLSLEVLSPGSDLFFPSFLQLSTYHSVLLWELKLVSYFKSKELSSHLF